MQEAKKTGVQRRVALLLGALIAVALSVAHAQGEAAELDPDFVAEDEHFDPYGDKADRPRGVGDAPDAPAKYAPKARSVESFDFDPSEGLTFFVGGQSRECFFQDAKFEGDELGGAYIVSSADSHIDLEVTNPQGVAVFRRLGDAEGQYQVSPKQAGVFQLCFINSDADGKLVTHVTNTLQSQHPVEQEHVSVLAKYASHVDVRLGELESEQRLQLIRTDRHLKVEEETNKRVAFYGSLECVVYLGICFFQVFYIKSLLDNPRKSRSWV